MKKSILATLFLVSLVAACASKNTVDIANLPIQGERYSVTVNLLEGYDQDEYTLAAWKVVESEIDTILQQNGLRKAEIGEPADYTLMIENFIYTTRSRAEDGPGTFIGSTASNPLVALVTAGAATLINLTAEEEYSFRYVCRLLYHGEKANGFVKLGRPNDNAEGIEMLKSGLREGLKKSFGGRINA